MDRKSVFVTGMSCSGCEERVENALMNLSGVNRVDANCDAGTVDVVVEEDVDEGDLYTMIEQAGYDVSE
ncbi:MAG: heavy metal-associated domain-containing protein [Halobacteria archaeon]